MARRLNNTRAVCRRCYIHPGVIDAWNDQTLQLELQALKRRYPRPFKGLDIDETIVLRWLNTLED
ncbi:hypothetical protein [Hoeflea ulvae]|uniref:Transposase n=1 Tax=Hoeflea ulvae TaxID=2983764 RepID=A0ABT3YM70_9HYPH|nr:hypothetical protein [Hoeflea ulvae]MCY0096933.1 hypothetical protein [Hoeflea ulvae]